LEKSILFKLGVKTNWLDCSVIFISSPYPKTNAVTMAVG
jgi:hypothetical protein